jgi:nitrate reductase (NAD(P)H)
MTVGFNLLQVGDTVDLKGPLGSFIWKGNGTASWRGTTRKLNEIGLVCGGSGESLTLRLRFG